MRRVMVLGDVRLRHTMHVRHAMACLLMSYIMKRLPVTQVTRMERLAIVAVECLRRGSLVSCRGRVRVVRCQGQRNLRWHVCRPIGRAHGYPHAVFDRALYDKAKASASIRISVCVVGQGETSRRSLKVESNAEATACARRRCKAASAYICTAGASR